MVPRDPGGEASPRCTPSGPANGAQPPPPPDSIDPRPRVAVVCDLTCFGAAVEEKNIETDRVKVSRVLDVSFVLQNITAVGTSLRLVLSNHVPHEVSRRKKRTGSVRSTSTRLAVGHKHRPGEDPSAHT